MRRIWIVILLCAARGPSSEPQARLDHPADKAAIQALLDAHSAAWTKGDTAAAAAVMAEDADWVSGSGAVHGGRPAIEAMHRRELAGMGKGGRHSHPGTPRFGLFVPTSPLWTATVTWLACTTNREGNFLPLRRGIRAVMVKESGR